MENEELLPGDEISQDETRLNPEISREEGNGSWDEIEQEEEENTAGEIESGTEDNEEPLDTQQGISLGADPIGEPGEMGPEGSDEEEEDDQKNTLSDKSPRVLSFKDFFSQN